MISTVANQFGITFENAEELAVECARRKWLEHSFHTVSLRQGGFAAALRALQAASTIGPDRPLRPLGPSRQLDAGLVLRSSVRLLAVVA
jgi:hypothetical protein